MIRPNCEGFFAAILFETGFYNIRRQSQSEIELYHINRGIGLKEEAKGCVKLMQRIQNPAVVFNAFPFDEEIVYGGSEFDFVVFGVGGGAWGLANVVYELVRGEGVDFQVDGLIHGLSVRLQDTNRGKKKPPGVTQEAFE